MSSQENRNWQEWRAELADTGWPFAAGVSLRSKDNRVLIPGQIIDIILHPVGGVGKFYISSVEISGDWIKINFGDSGQQNRCFASFQWINPPEQVNIVDEYHRIAGIIVLNPLLVPVFGSWGEGIHEFSPSASELVATVCVPVPEQGLRGILLENGELLTGEVWIAGGPGVVVRPETEYVMAANGTSLPVIAIRVDVVGDPYFRRRLCAPAELFETPKFIKEIRVEHELGSFTCSPDESGNLQIETNNSLAIDSAIRIAPTESGLSLTIAGA